jgi:hypothetical protein
LRTPQIVTYGRRLPSGLREAIWTSSALPILRSSSAVHAVIGKPPWHSQKTT